jgi:hypothetical protein
MQRNKRDGAKAFECLCSAIGPLTKDSDQRERWHGGLRRMQRAFDGATNNALFWFTMVLGHVTITHRDDLQFEGDEILSQAVERDVVIYREESYPLSQFPMRANERVLDSLGDIPDEDLYECRIISEAIFSRKEPVDPEADDFSEDEDEDAWQRILNILKR